MTAPMSRDEVLALPPVITLEVLGRVLDVSDPVVRRLNSTGELAALGIRVNRLGAQWRVVTSSVLEYLGLAGGASTAAADGNGAGQRGPAAPVLRLAAGDGSPGLNR